MSCCPPNSEPARLNPTTDETPLKIGSTPVFFYDNAASEHLVLVFPDAMGPDSSRTKANCVKLSADFKVALVDITPEYLTDLSKVAEWVQARPFESLLPKVHEVVRHFKSVHNVNKVAALGYCWGAWIAARYSGVQANELSAAISFHPSWFLQDLLDGEERSGVKIAHDISVPQLILTAGNDRDWLKPGGDVERILKDRGIPAKLREFPNVAHGWMNRGELTEVAVATAFQAAWDEEALPFLREYLK
ncbi:unnamed protein product [Aphanomyces euteiches]|uniref:Dienelactone hydrolase domain-containing protein n=1 Tax=Aphanomyces euteiches TaxID=100861 RepID=A0A6G0WW35_9STRA|nr:hypothetical protein Ae201684_011000 [Aphanomyces euteiches]KAH9058442.1 hypothetical protein Ae201684P_005785 [Aphanomyces euteiches]KAH9143062.1 hypothetical protein AeRB84_012914 [Aphanomyces euteiches]